MATSPYKILQQAGANPIKIVPVDPVIVARYKTPNFDGSLFSDQFMDWENSSCYAQKWNQNDQTAMQFHVNSDQKMNVYLVDKDDRVWKDYSSQNFYDMFSGNTIVRDGVTFQLYTATFVIDFVGLPDGLYFLKVVPTFDVQTGTEPTAIYISEPQYISSYIDNTLLIEYKNNKIAFNTYFGTWGFRIRIEGYIGYNTPDSVDTQYNDEYYNIKMLNSYTYRKFRLLIGRAAGVPAYIIDKLNIATGCSTLKIDSTYYTKDEGAKISVTQYDRRLYATLDLREAENYADQTFVSVAGLIILIIPSGMSALRAITLGGTTWYMQQIIDPNNTTALINWLNGTFAPANGLQGTFIQQGNTVLYQQADTESWTGSSSVVLDKFVEIDKQSTGTFNLNIEATYAVVDWGENNATFGHGTGAILNQTIPYNYVTSLRQSIRIYHSNTLNIINCGDNSIFNISGDFGNAFGSLQLSAANIPNFDISILNSTASYIKIINLSNCRIQQILNYAANYPLIQQLVFSGNNLNSHNCDTILMSTQKVVSRTPGMQGAGHTLNVKNQIPLAPPSFSGANAATSLRSMGWTVNTD
jgi:hypothetical protein